MGADEDEEMIDIDNPQDDQMVEELHVITADVSHVHTLEGRARPKAIKLIGIIGDSKVQVLFDTDSLHNFLHPSIAEKLSLPLRAVTPFRVYVGNRASLICSHISLETDLVLQGTTFVIDLHILPIRGPNIILGMEWLQSLGRVTHDYVHMMLDFICDDCPIQLQGIAPQPRLVSLQRLAIILSCSPRHEIYEIVPVLPPSDSLPTAAARELSPDLSLQIRSILEKHMAVFSILEGLPPSRPFDHRIHLLPNTKPLNVRPYRYPYFQKNEIEQQVKGMLEQGIIQHSQSILVASSAGAEKGWHLPLLH